MTGKMVYHKDPQAVLDYLIDWGRYLPSGDVISTSTWTATTGITIASNSKTSTTTTVWLSGGTAGTNYSVTNHISTTGGRQDDRTLTITCKQL